MSEVIQPAPVQEWLEIPVHSPPETVPSLLQELPQNIEVPVNGPFNQEVVLNAQSGDVQAQAQIYEHFHSRIHNYVSKRLGGVEAEDVTSEVFLKVLANISMYRNVGHPFSSWVYSIARNEIVNFTRKRKRIRDHEFREGTMDNWNTSDGGQFSYEENFGDPVLKARLEDAVNLLPPAMREVIELRFGKDVSVETTARTLNKTQNNVKVLQHKGVKKLRTLMTPLS